MKSLSLPVFAAFLAFCTSSPAYAEREVNLEKLLKKKPSSLQKSCDRDKAPECFALAVKYSDALGVTQDLPKALSLAKKSCELNFARGCTGYGFLISSGRGQDPEVAEYLYAGCALGDLRGCTLTLPYAYGRRHSLKGRDRRIQVAQKTCQVGNEAGCEILEDLGATHTLITDPMEMNRLELQWYVGNTLDYKGAARSIVARHPDGTGFREHPDSEYLGELIVNMGSAQFKTMDDDFVKTVARKQFWRKNIPATKIALGEWNNRMRAKFAARIRIDNERAAANRANARTASSSSSGPSSTRSPVPTTRQSAKICYWVTNSGIGEGRYRKCE